MVTETKKATKSTTKRGTSVTQDIFSTQNGLLGLTTSSFSSRYLLHQSPVKLMHTVSVRAYK